MGKCYCDYCDVFLTHDSISVRKQHNDGNRHRQNVCEYYRQFIGRATQQKIDEIVAAFELKVAQGLVRPSYGISSINGNPPSRSGSLRVQSADVNAALHSTSIPRAKDGSARQKSGDSSATSEDERGRPDQHCKESDLKISADSEVVAESSNDPHPRRRCAEDSDTADNRDSPSSVRENEKIVANPCSARGDDFESDIDKRYADSPSMQHGEGLNLNNDQNDVARDETKVASLEHSHYDKDNDSDMDMEMDE